MMHSNKTGLSFLFFNNQIITKINFQNNKLAIDFILLHILNRKHHLRHLLKIVLKIKIKIKIILKQDLFLPQHIVDQHYKILY
jgi:hypothetical protein